MKGFTQLLLLSLVWMSCFTAAMSQIIEVDFRNANYSSANDQICFDVFMRAGTGYPGGATWSTMNIRIDFDMDIASGNPVLAAVPAATITNVNTTYIAGGVSRNNAPGAPFTGYDFFAGFFINRGGAATDLPVDYTLMFSVCLPVINGEFEETSMTDNMRLRQEDTAPGPQNGSSFWNASTGGPRAFGNEQEPLPIELLTFEPRLEDCELSLYWETAQEKNLGYYEVEASRDGQRFKVIAQVKPATSNSSTLQVYKYAVPQAYQGYYFRLKALDLDGQHTYSTLVYGEMPCKELYAMNVYPNPNYLSELTVEVQSPEERQEVWCYVLDGMGRRVRAQKTDLKQGSNKLQIPTSELPSGTYYVQIVGIQQLSQPQKFVRSNF